MWQVKPLLHGLTRHTSPQTTFAEIQTYLETLSQNYDDGCCNAALPYSAPAVGGITERVIDTMSFSQNSWAVIIAKRRGVENLKTFWHNALMDPESKVKTSISTT